MLLLLIFRMALNDWFPNVGNSRLPVLALIFRPEGGGSSRGLKKATMIREPEIEQKVIMMGHHALGRLAWERTVREGT